MNMPDVDENARIRPLTNDILAFDIILATCRMIDENTTYQDNSWSVLSLEWDHGTRVYDPTNQVKIFTRDIWISGTKLSVNRRSDDKAYEVSLRNYKNFVAYDDDDLINKTHKLLAEYFETQERNLGEFLNE